VGESAVESIIAAREQGGPFKDVFDFCLRIDLKRVNKKVLEALIKSGAFDGLDPQANRARMLALMEIAVERAQKEARERESGQTNLFALMGEDRASNARWGEARAALPLEGGRESPPLIDEWAPKQRLGFEKESLGFYITGHPLDRYQTDLKRFRAARTVDVQERTDWDDVQVGGIVGGYKEWPLKSGEGRMCVFTLEDTFGSVRVACFAKAFAAYETVLKSDEPILVTGKVKPGRVEGDDEAQKAAKELNLTEAIPLAQLRAEKTRQMTVELSADALTDERVDALKAALQKHPGSVTTVLRLKVPLRSITDCVLPAQFNVSPTDELLVRIEKLFGENAARLR
jgi:DNA polymerase-3 subunit alpha